MENNENEKFIIKMVSETEIAQYFFNELLNEGFPESMENCERYASIIFDYLIEIGALYEVEEDEEE